MRWLSLCLGLLAIPAMSHAGLEERRIAVDGISREFLVYEPAGAAPTEGRPVVFVLHGGGGTARQIMRSTKRQFNQLADTNGALIVYPQAIDRLWDFGEGVISSEFTNPRDDLKFILSTLQLIGRGGDVNEENVFATGMSRGGQAAYNLACKAPGRFAAIAPVAMSLPEVLRDDCARMPATGLLVINGTADPLVPWAGGPIRVRGRDRDLVLSTPETMAFMRRRNGCDAGTKSVRIGAVDRIEWTGCRAPTIVMRVNGGGHAWPGGRSVLLARIVGETNRDIDATREIWRFFFSE